MRTENQSNIAKKIYLEFREIIQLSCFPISHVCTTTTLSFQRIDNVSHIARESSEGREEILSECLSENDRGEEDEDGGNGDRVCVIEILASWSPNKSFPRREHCFRNPNLFDCRRTARRRRRRKLGSGTGR